MTTTEYRVTGMTCGHCERAVADEVAGIGQVEVLEVDAATGRLLVASPTELDDAAVLAAVDEAGYQAVRVP
jgi:copper chaperone